MKQNHSTEGVCPGCGRQCPADDLHCPRGAAYFGREADIKKSPDGGHGHAHKPEIKDETVILMLKCGHYLHHGLAEENEEVLSFLSHDEKNELTKLLKKCVEQWYEKGV